VNHNHDSDQHPHRHPEFLHPSVQKIIYPNGRDHFHHRTQDDDEDTIKRAIANTEAYNLALQAANPGDTILLLENQSYSFLGGIEGVNVKGVTLDFAGYTRFIYELEHWPMRQLPGDLIEEYVPAIDLSDCSDVVVTCSAKNKAIVTVDFEKNEIYLDKESGSGGIIDGHGKKWWDSAIFGTVGIDARPRLMDVRGSMNVTIEHLTLVNSPYWTLTLEAIGAEVHHVNVLIDRNYQRGLINNTAVELERAKMKELWHDTTSTTTIPQTSRYLRESSSLQRNKNLQFPHFPDLIPDWILQPQDLNTDGIDPIGRDIHIHHCIILNDDDSIAVKPPLHEKKGFVMNGTVPYECTGNITIEDMVLTGFGASIGSVGPLESHPCVDNVRFRNIKMPGSAKGIYIKSNKSDCNGDVSSRITNIL
jgi:hypothetical protein